MRWVLAPAIALAALAVADRAHAHVAPSVNDNNRYIKLTPLGDGVRLAYVVFFGEIPGAQLRPTLDTNRDGAISEAEGAAFGTRLAGEIAASLELTVDGAPLPIAWTTISVGMGTPRVTGGGAFSVDLVASICAPARGRHALRLRDRFRLQRPGETELRVEATPGVAIERAAIGDARAPSHEFRFTGPAGALADPGLELAFTTSESASPGACLAPDKPGSSRRWIAALAAGIALAAGALAVARARGRARRRAARRP